MLASTKPAHVSFMCECYCVYHVCTLLCFIMYVCYHVSSCACMHTLPCALPSVIHKQTDLEQLHACKKHKTLDEKNHVCTGVTSGQDRAQMRMHFKSCESLSLCIVQTACLSTPREHVLAYSAPAGNQCSDEAHAKKVQILVEH